MQSLLIRYKMLAKRWVWLIILGIVLCGGGTYIVSKLTQPVYQASALIVLNLGSSANTPYENINGSLAALPTYSQLLTNPAVLKPVVVAHKGLTLNQLNNMIAVKPQANTQIIELDVKDTNPQLAMELANEVSYTFAGYENKQNPAAVQILPAQLPEVPVSPRPLSYAGIGALVGLALALALIVAFEWIDDRLANPEEVQEILGFDTLTIIPQFSRKQGSIDAKKTQALAEGSRVLAASLKATQAFIKPFKVVMVTSALAGEGKSTIAAHLASSLAMTGKNVLLVDTNLRHPVLDQRFQMDNQHGLSNAFLEKGGSIERLDVRITEIPTLRVLTSGVLPSNPPELLQSPPAEQLFDHFKKSSQFDYVILDAPPLLPVADAQILASYAQVTLLVIDASKTPRKVLLRAKQVLNRTRTTVIGVALNKSPWPDYNDIRQYLRGIAPKAKSDVTMPPSPPVDDITIPTTPRMNGNGMAESDSTISIPTTPRMNGNEVADPNSTITIPLRDTKQ
ncbi:MAG: polysaccharide biosynthesis tyrosine autokinase [Ktedonobacteraceae bacterium]